MQEVDCSSSGKKIAILGHSYVSRLRFTSPLKVPGFEVRKFGSPRAKVTNIMERPVWEECIPYRPDYTLLLLGGNDINVNTKPSDLGREISNLTLKVEELTGGVCHLINIESCLQPRDILPDRYKTIRCLGRYVHLKHRVTGMGMETDDLGQDGVHLSAEGNEKLLQLLLQQCHDFFGNI